MKSGVVYWTLNMNMLFYFFFLTLKDMNQSSMDQQIIKSVRKKTAFEILQYSHVINLRIRLDPYVT